MTLGWFDVIGRNQSFCWNQAGGRLHAYSVLQCVCRIVDCKASLHRNLENLTGTACTSTALSENFGSFSSSSPVSSATGCLKDKLHLCAREEINQQWNQIKLILFGEALQ